MWVIANNSSGDYSSWPTCIARPDGSMETLERGVPGILYREFPDDKIIKDFPSWTHNNKIMKLAPQEVYHNGIPSNHPRALDTKSLPYQIYVKMRLAWQKGMYIPYFAIIRTITALPAS